MVQLHCSLISAGDSLFLSQTGSGDKYTFEPSDVKYQLEGIDMGTTNQSLRRTSRHPNAAQFLCFPALLCGLASHLFLLSLFYSVNSLCSNFRKWRTPGHIFFTLSMMFLTISLFSLNILNYFNLSSYTLIINCFLIVYEFSSKPL